MLNRRTKFKFKINDQLEQENLEVFNVANGEINLIEVKNMSEDKKEMRNEVLKNMRDEQYKANFKKLDQHEPKKDASKVNMILRKIPSKTLTGTKNLINAEQNCVTKNMGLKVKKHVKRKGL